MQNKAKPILLDEEQRRRQRLRQLRNWAILLGVIGSVASQVGDLTASLLKRHSGIKDYGKLFPGHGGVMDRFDSVIFALIVMYCYTLVLHG